MKDILISGFSDEIGSDFELQLKTVTELGMNFICLRSAYGKNICDYTPAEARERLLPLLDRYGVSVSAIGSPIGKTFVTDEPGFVRALELCKRAAELADVLECRTIRLFSFYLPAGDPPDRWRGAVMEKLRRIVGIFRDAGILALHENEKDIYGDTAARCRDLIETIGEPSFRAIFDFANFIQCGEAPEECYRILKPYIREFHIKDALADSRENVVCGSGNGHIREILTDAVQKGGYRGFLTLEPHLVLFDALQSLELADASQIIGTPKARDGKDGYAMQYRALTRILEPLSAP